MDKLGYVDEDERWMRMEEFDSMLDGETPSEIVTKAFYGGDLDWKG